MILEGRSVLITGGRRVGSHLARLFAERGASVAMTYHRSKDVIEETVAEVRARGVKGLAVSADLTQAAEAEAAVEATAKAFGRIDVLVNMASVYRQTRFDTLKPEDFDALIATNLAAPYFTSVAAAKRMRTQRPTDGLRGKIVIVGDWATERPYRHYLPYLTAKGGLATLTMALARELAPEVTVNLVQPAMIDPPPDLTDAEIQAVVEATPLRRIGTPGDLNRLILYLVEGTDFATGGRYRVDGGRFLGSDD
ncbi:MAG: SDR family NAD(P)-dependent oxidoreductase [Isosphaeraceae bacterium]